MARFKYSIIGDILVIFYGESTPHFLLHYYAVTQSINESSDPSLHENVRQFICLVKDYTGEYNGIIPVSGRVSADMQEMEIAWLHEEDQQRAVTLLKQAYDKGADTRPLL